MQQSDISLIERVTRQFNFVFLANTMASTEWNTTIIDDEDLIILKWDNGYWELIFLHDDKENKSIVKKENVLDNFTNMVNKLKGNLKPIASYVPISNILAKDLKQLKKIKTTFTPRPL